MVVGPNSDDRHPLVNMVDPNIAFAILTAENYSLYSEENGVLCSCCLWRANEEKGCESQKEESYGRPGACSYSFDLATVSEEDVLSLMNPALLV